MTRVEVLWEDAQQHDDGPWLSSHDTIKPCIVRQVGYIHEHNRERLVLVYALNDNGQSSPRDVIPTGMIRSITELVSGKPLPIKPRRKYAPTKDN